MSLTNDQVRHISKLAVLRVDEGELEKTKEQLNSILNYIDQLQKIETRGVIPTSHVHGVVNNFRDDIIQRSLTQEEALTNAPDAVSLGFRVPRIIG